MCAWYWVEEQGLEPQVNEKALRCYWGGVFSQVPYSLLNIAMDQEPFGKHGFDVQKLGKRKRLIPCKESSIVIVMPYFWGRDV